MGSRRQLIVSIMVIGACGGGGGGGGGTTTENLAPHADAGPDQNVAVGALVTLDGGASSDVDGDELAFSWSLMAKPTGSAASLSNAATVRPTFTADLDGVYVFNLVVDDGADSAADTVTVTALRGNVAPTANAGPDQNVATGTRVTLDASASSDADGDLLAYSWSLIENPPQSAAALSSTSDVKPTFTPDRDGSYVISLVVNDGRLNSAADMVTVTAIHVNVAPTANAGPDQNVATGSLVTLDGSASSDPNGDPITYRWALTSKPQDSTAALSNGAAARPTFTADRAGSYVIQLIVNDGTVDSAADTVTVTAATASSAPVANAGGDQNVSTGSVVTLDGSASSDADGNALTFSWSFTSRPQGSSAVLASATSARPTFTADRDGSYVIRLVVNDGTVNSAPDTVTVTAATSNSAPVANAGPDQNLATGSLVTLDAGASSDADNDLLAYSWSFTSKPDGSTAALANPTWARPTFTADRDGSYVIRLVVNDGTVNSAADTVTITAAPGNSPPVADAGLDQNIKTGSLVSLNGIHSTDADNDPLTCSWSFIARPEGSTATLANATSFTPNFTADRDGSYVISLVVNDGTVNSLPDTVIVTAATGNSAPVAYAGVDRTTRTGFAVVYWLASAWDADNDPLTYSWWITSRPEGSTAILGNATSLTPTFTPDLDGTYVFSFVVNDGKVNSAIDSVTITALPTNIAPVANAGSDQSVPTGIRVTLSGTGSDGDDDWPLTFSWSFVSKPAGSTATLMKSDSWWPTFIADRDGSYVISLVVSDSVDFSEPDTVTITASYQNLAPVADAGPDQNVAIGALVTLDGSASSDINPDVLSYAWSFTSRPTGSTAALAGATSMRPTFTADLDGVYVVSLLVSDGALASIADSVSIATMPSASTDCTDGLRPDMTFELGTMGEAHSYRHATNTSSAAVVVWMQTDWLTGQSSLWARRCLPGQGWTLPARLDRATGSALEADVAIDSDGNAIAVWRERDGTQYNVYASRALATASWESATLLDGSSGEVLEPIVAISDAGRATAVWRQWNGTTWALVVSHHTWTSGWETEQLLSDGVVEAAFHRVAMDGSGRTLVLWRYWTYPSSTWSGMLYWAVHSPSTGWSTPARLDQAIGSGILGFVVMNRDGAAMAIWLTTYGDTTGIGLFVNRYQPGTGWGSPAKLAETFGDVFYGTSLWLSPRGVGLVSWGQGPFIGGGSTVIAASNVPPATSWTPTSLSTYHAGGGAILGNGSENPIAVWTDLETFAVYANRFTPATGWDSAILLRTGTADENPFPAALERDQDLLFIWRSASHKELEAVRQQWP